LRKLGAPPCQELELRFLFGDAPRRKLVIEAPE
jgi:hypothetical protein